MATAAEFLPIADLRDGLGIAGDGSDETLMSIRGSAIDHVTSMTARNIIDRTFETRRTEFVYVSLGGPVDMIRFRVPDVTGIAGPLRYRAKGTDALGRGSSTQAIDFASDRVSASERELSIYSDANDRWFDRMEFNDPTPSLRVSVGVPAASIPDAWRQAAILIVRAVFDGSGFDSMPTGNPVERLLAPYARQAFDDFG